MLDYQRLVGLCTLEVDSRTSLPSAYFLQDGEVILLLPSVLPGHSADKFLPFSTSLTSCFFIFRKSTLFKELQRCVQLDKDAIAPHESRIVFLVVYTQNSI